jgi:hypothetical protein
MKNTPPAKRQDPFPFVLQELLPIRPVVKRMFGFTHVYLGERLLLSLRQSAKRPATNGMWLYTTVEHLESLGREFPELPRRCLWRSGKNAWVILSSRLESFEEYAYTACELILRGDRRVGRATRGGRAMAEGEGESSGEWESRGDAWATTTRPRRGRYPRS